MSGSFARLFRNSQFAKFDPSIPRVVQPSKLPAPGQILDTHCHMDRPAFFGFKKDLPPRHYGRPLDYVQLKSLDGNYGQCELRNGAAAHRKWLVLSELQRLLGTAGFEGRMPLMPNGVRLPGRLLGRRPSGGYLVAVGGLVCELAPQDIPPLVHFSATDLAARKTLLFYVTSVQTNEKGHPRVRLSLRPPVTS